jgi:hypothetical protein
MNRNKLLPILLVVAILLVGGFLWFKSGGDGFFPDKWTGVEGEAINVALDFYEGWLDARKVGDNEPFTRGLLEYVQLSTEVKDKLSAYEGKLVVGEEDPVLCQTELPEGLRTIPVYVQEEAAQILVMSTTKGQSGQAVVSMKAKNNLWQITDISCGNAEAAPDREFSFEKSGFLLKQVPAPLDSKNWHLVFEEAGVLGHAVPLFFNSDSVCIAKDGSTATCDDNFLKETMPATVKGELSESGVDVKRVELVDAVEISD